MGVPQLSERFKKLLPVLSHTPFGDATGEYMPMIHGVEGITAYSGI